MQADITDGDATQRIATDTVTHFDRIDILVNCAGIGPALWVPWTLRSSAQFWTPDRGYRGYRAFPVLLRSWLDWGARLLPMAE
jgi:NAD(P)-dependent dehydrogenase (short-subunit alcohol dehydrogenase family)